MGSPTWAQTFPPRGITIYKTLISQNPVDCTSDDQRRGVARKIAEQMRFEFGETWGWKSAGTGRPPSKDVVAQLEGDSLHGWEYQQGGTCTPYDPPHYHNLNGQQFIPVEPVNHLGGAIPTTPQPQPNPEPDPLPSVDLSAMYVGIDTVIRTTGSIETRLIELENKLDEHIKSTEAFQARVKGAWEGTFKPILSFLGKYVAPAIGGWVISQQVNKD